MRRTIDSTGHQVHPNPSRIRAAEGTGDDTWLVLFTSRGTMKTIEDVIDRLRAEFREMPGLRLYLGQVQRLCDIERSLCETALDSLVAEGFLHAKGDGTYARISDQESVHPRPAKARLRHHALRDKAAS